VQILRMSSECRAHREREGLKRVDTGLAERYFRPRLCLSTSAHRATRCR
jgi:hypothetical protein